MKGVSIILVCVIAAAVMLVHASPESKNAAQRKNWQDRLQQLKQKGNKVIPVSLKPLDDRDTPKTLPYTLNKQNTRKSMTVQSRTEPQYAPSAPPAPSPQCCGRLETAYVTKQEQLKLKDEVREMFYHAYNGYLTHAFPADQLRPKSCSPHRRDTSQSANVDHMGGWSLTLLESLSTLAVMGDKAEFSKQLQWIINHLNFDSATSIVVSVFEGSIRVLGSLLSAHMLASDPALALAPNYRGELLAICTDLGERLLPAFNTNSGIPGPRVDLKGPSVGTTATRYGVDNNLAAAGTLMLEFGLLSRLTGDMRFEGAARHALAALWKHRSAKNLLGSTVNVATVEWVIPTAGIGSGSDSFYEYLLKSYVLFGDRYFLDVFEGAYNAVKQYMRMPEGWYVDVDIYTGEPRHNWMDSFSAFWPGLSVLGGDIDAAWRLHSTFTALARKYDGMLPEVFNIRTCSPKQDNWPLRPEHAESTWSLYRATKDPYFLAIGRDIVRTLQKHCRTACGFAAVYHVDSKETEDQMDSFFLSETLKYLYLLFDDDNFINRGDYVFNTEGQPFAVTHPAARTPPKALRLNAAIGEGITAVNSKTARCPRPPSLFEAILKYPALDLQELCYVKYSQTD